MCVSIFFWFPFGSWCPPKTLDLGSRLLNEASNLQVVDYRYLLLY